MKRNGLKNVTIFVGMGAGEMTCATPDGEVKFIEGLNPGRHLAQDWAQYMDVGDELSFVGSVTILKKEDGNVKPMKMGRHDAENGIQTGANPDFRPTKATEAEVRMQRLLKEVNKKTNALDGRIATLTRIEKERKAQIEKEDPPVIEPPAEDPPAEDPPKEVAE